MGSTFLEVILSTTMSKSSTMLFLVVVVSCLVCVQSQSIFFGGCPSVNVVPNFDANKYLGDWYENRKYCATFEFAQRCIMATSELLTLLSKSLLAFLYPCLDTHDRWNRLQANWESLLPASSILPLIRHIGFLVLIIPLTLLFGAVLTSDCSIPNCFGF